MNTAKILSIVKNKNSILIDTPIDPDIPVIIDFFNVYCSIIQFNKYKTFSRKTFVLCMKLLLNKFKHNKEVIIVSKNIFEVELDYIKNITLNNSNVKYLIVQDLNLPKGENRERDDYVCLLSQLLFVQNNKKSVILTNDCYKNYKPLIKNTKNLMIQTYIKGVEQENIDIDQDFISSKEEQLKDMCENKLRTMKFKFSV